MKLFLALFLAISVMANSSVSQALRVDALEEQLSQFMRQDRYGDAEPLATAILAVREKTLGENHPDVARTLRVLAKIHVGQKRDVEAEPLLKRALGITEARFSAEPSDFALAELYASLSPLADLYRDQSRYSEAAPLYERLLGINEKALAPDDPIIANSLNKLADAYKGQERYAEAEPLYRRALAVMELQVGAEDPDVIPSLRNLASLYSLQHQFAEAEPIVKRILAIKEKIFGADHPAALDTLSFLAALHRVQSRYADAEQVEKRALTIKEKEFGADDPRTADTLNNLAMTYHAQGRYVEAGALYQRVLAIEEKAPDVKPSDIAARLQNLGQLYVEQGRYAEAEEHFKRSLAIYESESGAEDIEIGFSLHFLASLYVAEARYAQAESFGARALAILEKSFGPDNDVAGTSLNTLAAIYLGQDRHADAVPLIRKALAIKEKIFGPNHPEFAKSLDVLASLHQALRDFDAALRVSTRSVEIMERYLDDGAGQRSGAGAAERRKARQYFLRNVALIDAAAAQDPTFLDGAERAFIIAQLAQVSGAAEAVAGMAARFASGGDALAAVVRDRQDQTERWRRIDAALVKSAGSSPADRNLPEEAKLRQALEEAGGRLNALDSRIGAEFPQYAELSAPKPLSADVARALLAPDEALLFYLIGPKQSWLWALRRDKIELHRIDLDADQLKGEVQALRQALDPTFNPRLKPFPATRAYELHQKILAPATALLTGARHVFIVPDAALESLPIGVLVTKPPKAEPDDPEDHREVAWFAREHAVTVLPSVSSLRALRLFTTAARASKPFLGIGAPTLEGQPGKIRGAQLASLFRGAVADVDAVRKLDPLPETADELRAVARSRGADEADLLLGERATEPQIRAAALEGHQVVHFATHGLVVGEMKGLAEPALVLTPPAQATPEDDGLLTASKVATLTLNADWVVLSACNTAAGDGTPGAGGLSGLAKAFFYAGARSLLVSHWSVPSEATVKLVTGAFDALGQEPGIGRAEALRRSQMAMLDPSAKPEFAHPLFWGPFVLAGEGGAGR